MNARLTPYQQAHAGEPIAQVDVLLLFSSALQSQGHHATDTAVTSAKQAWLTVDVWGTPGKSAITGRPVLEDMRLEVNGEDVEPLLGEDMVERIADYVLGNE